VSRLRVSALVLASLVLAPRRPARTRPRWSSRLNCQGCHRADGTGTPGSVPALADSVARFLAVPAGREYLVQVPGVAQAPLDDAALGGRRQLDADALRRATRPEGLSAVHRRRDRALAQVAAGGRGQGRASLLAELGRSAR
jgi:hypothetical protein